MYKVLYCYSFAPIKFIYMFCEKYNILNTNHVNHNELHYLPALIINKLDSEEKGFSRPLVVILL